MLSKTKFKNLLFAALIIGCLVLSFLSFFRGIPAPHENIKDPAELLDISRHSAKVICKEYTEPSPKECDSGAVAAEIHYWLARSGDAEAVEFLREVSQFPRTHFPVSSRMKWIDEMSTREASLLGDIQKIGKEGHSSEHPTGSLQGMDMGVLFSDETRSVETREKTHEYTSAQRHRAAMEILNFLRPHMAIAKENHLKIDHDLGLPDIYRSVAVKSISDQRVVLSVCQKTELGDYHYVDWVMIRQADPEGTYAGSFSGFNYVAKRIDDKTRNGLVLNFVDDGLRAASLDENLQMPPAPTRLVKPPLPSKPSRL